MKKYLLALIFAIFGISLFGLTTEYTVQSNGGVYKDTDWSSPEVLSIPKVPNGIGLTAVSLTLKFYVNQDIGVEQTSTSDPVLSIYVEGGCDYWWIDVPEQVGDTPTGRTFTTTGRNSYDVYDGLLNYLSDGGASSYNYNSGNTWDNLTDVETDVINYSGAELNQFYGSGTFDISCGTDDLMSTNGGGNMSVRILTLALAEATILYTHDDPLAVTLSTFTAEYSNGKPRLNWTTQSEGNNAYWNVYRSISQNLGQASWLNVDEMIEGAGTITEPTDYTYVDMYGVEENTTYYYWIECVDNAGETDNYGPVSLFIPEGIVNNGTPASPDDYGLKQNFPNPFNPDTRISFALEEDGPAQITIYNLKGNKIKTIFDEVVEADMVQSAYWDGKDENGKTVATGVYLYRLKTNSTNYTKRMLLMK